MGKHNPFDSTDTLCCQTGNRMRFYDVDSQQKTRCSFVTKYALYFMLFAVWVCSIAIVGIGIWTRVADYGSAVISQLVGYHLYQLDSFILIVGGSALFVVTVIGFCGAKFEHKCLLGLHIALMAFAAAMLLVGGSLGYVLIGEFEESVRNRMKTTLTENYGVELKKKNRGITNAWDDVQRNFKCCGVYGDANSTYSWSLYKTESLWFKNQASNANVSKSYVPKSCCGGTAEDLDMCQGKIDKHSYPVVGPPIKEVNKNSTMYLEGCYDKLVGNLEKAGITIGTASIAVSVFMIIELVLAIIMYRILRLKVYVID